MSDSLNKKWQDPWAYVQKLKERSGAGGAYEKPVLAAEEKLKRGDVDGAKAILGGLPEAEQCLGCRTTPPGSKQEVPDERYKPHFLGGPEPAAVVPVEEKSKTPKRGRSARPGGDA